MKDLFTKKWLTANSIQIVDQYEKGILTIRGLHYRLVAAGMTNDIAHYKRVVDAIIDARWNGLIDFDTFSDHDRFMIGETKNKIISLDESINTAKVQVRAWITNYNLNKWQNQYYYPEVLIEKKALQGVFQSVTDELDVSLGACKGYPSLTFLYDVAGRMTAAKGNGHFPIILYFGDYDPSGEDIPRSIKENIIKLGCPDIEVRRIALMKEQVIEMNLPPAPVKIADVRTAAWDGLGQVELDAVEPNVLRDLCRKAVMDVFDEDSEDRLNEIEKTEGKIFRAELKKFVSTL